MNFGTILIIILVIAAVVAVAFVVLRQRRMNNDPAYAARINEKRAARAQERQRKRVEKAELRAQKARYNEAIAPAKAELQKARQEYNSRVGRREDEVKKLTREYDKAIKAQEKAIAEIEKRYTQNIVNVGGVKLFADRIATKEATIPINGTLHAYLDSAADLLSQSGQRAEFRFLEAVEGETKPTASGSVVGGIGASETQLDVYVTPAMSCMFIYGTAVDRGNVPINICVPVAEKHLGDAHSFVESLNQLAENFEATMRKKDQELEDAAAELDRIREDTAAIDEARAAVERERADTQAVDAAQARFNEADLQAREQTGYNPR